MSNHYSSNQKAKNPTTGSREAGRDTVSGSKDNSRRNMNHDIRFINSQYDELFRIHDGGQIHVEKPEGGSFDATCEYIDDYHTRVNNRVFHICEFAELMERNNWTYEPILPANEISRDDQERVIEAMDAAGYYYDKYSSSPDSIRFTTDLGTVAYFDSWSETKDWISNVVIDDKFLAEKVQRILDPSLYKQNHGTYEIYQLKDTPENRDIRFERLSHLEKRGITVSVNNYDAVYSGKLAKGENLDSIYERFNLHHPDDFRGHSLSVSDVVVIHKNDRDIPFYVDAFGFRQVPEFFSDNPLKTVEELLEDDYGMIDGIINNGDRRKDEEEKKPSVMEKIQEKKKEAAEAEASRPKPMKREKTADREMDLS